MTSLNDQGTQVIDLNAAYQGNVMTLYQEDLPYGEGTTSVVGRPFKDFMVRLKSSKPH